MWHCGKMRRCFRHRHQHFSVFSMSKSGARHVLSKGGMNTALALVEGRSSDVRGTSTVPKILIADDDRDMCELAEAGLSQRGYSVSWRLSPDEALAHLDSEDFSILLVDIHME